MKKYETVSPDRSVLSAILEEFVPVVNEFEADYLREMRGIAEGAGVSFEDVLLLNTRSEVFQLAQSRGTHASTLASAGPDDGCTSVVILPEAAQTNELIQGQNWDWRSEAADTTVLLRATMEDGIKLLTLTEAGILGRAGLNSVGVCVTGNYIESNRDFRGVGVPIALIRRKILESAFLAQAFDVAYSTPKVMSSNTVVGHRVGLAIDFECSPEESFPIYPVDGLLVHANHWMSAVALSKQRDGGIAHTPDTLMREVRVRQLLTPRLGHVTVDDVKDALLDDFDSPLSVCQPAHMGKRGESMATVATIVMSPGRQCLDVARMPAHGGEFLHVSLMDDSSVVASLSPEAGQGTAV